MLGDLMVFCPKCGKDNPDRLSYCYWCATNLKGAVAVTAETRKEIKPVPPAIENDFGGTKIFEPQPISQTGERSMAGVIGYLLLIITTALTAFVSLSYELSVAVLVVAGIGVFMAGIAWHGLGKSLEDNLMKLYGILLPGMTLWIVAYSFSALLMLSAFGVGGTNIPTAYVLVAATAVIIPIILLLIIRFSVKSGTLQSVVTILLIISLAGFISGFFIPFLALATAVSLLSLSIIEIVLQVRSFFVAGNKLPSTCFKLGGWCTLIAIIISIALVPLIGSIVVLSSYGMAPSQALVAVGMVQWVSYIGYAFSIVASAFALIAFLGVEKSTLQTGVPNVPQAKIPVSAADGRASPDTVWQEEKERGPSMKIIVIVVVAIVILGVVGYVIYAGAIAAYVSGLYIGGATIPVTATVSGDVEDWNSTTTDNYRNGKTIVEATILTDDIDDVLDSSGELSITLTHHTRGWSTGAMFLGSSGKTTANYGETITMDGVLNIAEMTNNLYVKVTVPTTSGGDVTHGTTIRIDMWPTSDSASALDGNISAASHNPAGMSENWWDEKETLDITLVGRADALTLSGYDGAYLIGTTTT